MSETLLNEIRATKPEAPSALRERVRALSVQEPAREPFLDRLRFTWGWRRLALAVPATVVVAFVAAGVIGLSRDDVTRRGVRGRRRRRGRDDAPRSSGLRPRIRRRRRPPRRCPAAQPGSSLPPRASSSATRPSCACRSTMSRRSRPRRSARSRSRAATTAASPRCSTTRRRRASAPRRSRSASRRPASRARWRSSPQLGTIVGPALRDRRPAGTGRLAAVADRGDAAADRAAGLAAREHDALRRRARRAPVAALERPRRS